MAQSLFLHIAKVLGLFGVSRQVTAGSVRIICYHGAWLEQDGYPGDSMFISPGTFERRLEMLQRLGYQVISLADAVAGLKREKPLPANAVVITIDDGWVSTARAMVPALVRHGLPATLYCDTAHMLEGKPIAHYMALHFWRRAREEQRTPATRAVLLRAVDRASTPDRRLEAAHELARVLGVDLAPYIASGAFHYMSKDELREVAAAGIDIQLHTHNHTLRDFSAAAIMEEIKANRRALTEVLGPGRSELNHFCYPSGLCNEGAARLLEGMGIASATTLEVGLAIPGGDIQLLPRLIDGEQLSDLRFEAELAGFMHIVRGIWQRLESVPRAFRRASARVSERSAMLAYTWALPLL